MRILINLLSKILTPTAQKFEQKLLQPEQAQKAVQEEIFTRLIKSKYGQNLGIKSLEDWHKIPIVNYEDIKQWIKPVNEVRSQKSEVRSGFCNGDLRPAPKTFRRSRRGFKPNYFGN